MVDGERARGELEERRLRELVEVKNTFLRLTIHELRRPLGLSHGYLSMLQDGTCGELPETIRETVQRIESDNQEMANLVDGLAAIACLEDRAGALRLAPHRLGKVVAEAVAAVEMERAAKQIRIEPSVSAPDPEVEVDAERIRIVIVNLLTNAIK